MKRFEIFPGKNAPPPGPKPAVESRAPLVAGVPLGGIIPRKFIEHPHLVIIGKPNSPMAERYRRLRLGLEQAGGEGGAPQAVVVTSAVPEEGKTTTALNLALAMAEDGDRRTLLIDADLRRPSTTQYLTPQPTLGLAELLAGEAPLDHVLVEVKSAHLTILPSGKATGNPLKLLQSDYLGSVIAELRRRFDRIVIDTPPTVPFTDAAVMNAVADGAVLVIRARKTTKPLIERARQSLSHGNLLGIVLNDVRITAVDRYYYKYDDYDPERYRRRSSHHGERSGAEDAKE
jgi:succinoglycan biosynthesis transport protein ExoP